MKTYNEFRISFFILLLSIGGYSFSKSIQIMSYNVENLFDAEHDEGKNDWSYLPKGYPMKSISCKKMKSPYRRKQCLYTNWTKKHLEIKLRQIEKVIRKKTKNIPDILALIEIENRQVIHLLAKKLGYKNFILSNSPDRRGIDVALLYNENSNLKLIRKKEISINQKSYLKAVGLLMAHKKSLINIKYQKYFKKKPTRNILEAEFLIAKKYYLTLFVNHWPSLANPDQARIATAMILKGRISQLYKNKKEMSFIALGDFNTIPKLKNSGSEHPFRDILLKNFILNDLYHLFMKAKSISLSLKKSMAHGTYFYHRGRKWNFLDRIFISNSLLNEKTLRVDLPSFQIYAPSFIRKVSIQKKNKKTAVINDNPPLRYNHKVTKEEKAGYSDHFPLIFNLKY